MAAADLPPSPPPSSPGCADTSGDAVDRYGDHCWEYVAYPGWCGQYDDDDFDSRTCAARVAAASPPRTCRRPICPLRRCVDNDNGGLLTDVDGDSCAAYTFTFYCGNTMTKTSHPRRCAATAVAACGLLHRQSHQFLCPTRLATTRTCASPVNECLVTLGPYQRAPELVDDTTTRRQPLRLRPTPDFIRRSPVLLLRGRTCDMR